MRPTLVALVGLLGCVVALRAASARALPAADGADAGPQPGDVDETFPIVEDVDPSAPDAGPPHAIRVKSKPAPTPDVSDAGPEPAPTPDSDSTHATTDPDAHSASKAAASGTGDAKPKVDASKARVDDSTPRTDPDSLRAPDAPEVALKKDDAPPSGLGFGGVPAINYDADNGFGFGVIAELYFYDGKTRPYRASIELQIFMTSKLVQDHNVVVDWLDVADLPLRLYSRVGYLQSLTQNYCGLGGDVTCDPRAATDSHFYQRRFINPYGLVLARYALVEKPARFELMAGYRGFYFVPGSWDDANHDGKPDLVPYPGSLYAKDFPTGEPGFDSQVLLGFMLDTRDNEPAPTSGVWLEASVRNASSAIGSTWNWTGGNVTLRAYAPFDTAHKLVWANRFVVDGILGDPPIQEMARVGGSNDYYIYGGSDAGRGIRAQRYLGKLRAFDQNELRWTFADTEFLEQRFAFTAAAFADVGVVGKEILDPGNMDLLPGYGGALRIAWNENFIIRFDVGLSPIEGNTPQIYLLIGNPF